MSPDPYLQLFTVHSCRKLLYPPPTSEAGPSKPKPNVYNPFGLLDSRLEAALKQMVQEHEEQAEAATGEGLNGQPNSSNVICDSYPEQSLPLSCHVFPKPCAVRLNEGP